jgi:FAD/FMN-containing dehydrogenase
MGVREPALPTSVLTSLRDTVGSPHVLTDPEVTAGYAIDWTGRFRGASAAVVRPATTAEVAAVVRLCGDAGIAVVPQGGNTGLVGGGVPLHDELVLSLTRLDLLGELDRASAQVTAGAGVTLAQLQRHVGTHELALGVDLAPRDSCTIGGMVATNAGGTNVVRHGTMRAQVMGVEAVLGDGNVVSHLGGLMKDNTGYDLAGLLTGSEGTLGIVTAARLRLVPRFSHRVTAVLGLAGIAEAVAAVSALRAAVPSLDAAELVLADGVALVASVLGLHPPSPLLAPAALIVEAAANSDPLEELASAVARLELVGEPVVATAPEPRRRLWEIREAHGEAINRLGPPIKLDVSVPLAHAAHFVGNLPELLPPGARLVVFGHLGDGNLHVNVTGVLPAAAELVDADLGAAEAADVAEAVELAVLEAVVAEGGSISAEHGIGTAKTRYLHLCRSAAELDAFRRIKRALDPHGILNPHAILPPEDQ